MPRWISYPVFAPAAAPPPDTLYVVQRDGTYVTLRDTTQVEDRRP